MSDRSDLAAAIAFVIVLVVAGAAVVLLFTLEPGELRSATAGFLGGLIAVLAVGVARWLGGGRSERRPRVD